MGFLFPSDFMHLWVKNSVGNFPGGSVAGTSPSYAGSVNLIPGWEAMILQAQLPKKKKKTRT